MNLSDRFEILYEKPYVSIGWFTVSNIIKVTFIKDYSLHEARDITLELLGIIISKQSNLLFLHIGIPLNLSDEVKQYTITETFPLFEVYGIKKIAYLHFEGSSYNPIPIVNKSVDLSKIPVKVFAYEFEAINWLK